jgi:hypothetical protein
MDASVNKEEKSTQNINQVIKEALFKMSDPTPDMTDEERESYHRKLLAKLESGQKLTSGAGISADERSCSISESTPHGTETPVADGADEEVQIKAGGFGCGQ